MLANYCIETGSTNATLPPVTPLVPVVTSDFDATLRPQRTLPLSHSASIVSPQPMQPNFFQHQPPLPIPTQYYHNNPSNFNTGSASFIPGLPTLLYTSLENLNRQNTPFPAPSISLSSLQSDMSRSGSPADLGWHY